MYLNMMINKWKMESTDTQSSKYSLSGLDDSSFRSKLSVASRNFALLKIVKKLDSVVGSLPPSRSLKDAHTSLHWSFLKTVAQCYFLVTKVHRIVDSSSLS